MTAPRLMIFSAYYPGDHGTGSILLRDACRCYPRDRICAFSLMPRHPSDHACEWVPLAVAGQTLNFLPKPARTRAGRLLSIPFERLAARRRNAQIVREAVAFAREHRVELIWAVLDWAVNVETAQAVADALAIPLVSTAWDPPEYRVLSEGHTRLVQRSILRRFESLMHSSLRAGVASSEMAGEYQRRFGVETVVLRMGVDPALWRNPHTEPVEPGKLHIAFAGSLYAAAETQALIDTLGHANWSIAGREITLTLLSMSMHGLHADRPANVRWLGFRTPAETLDILSRADAGYLPYWFRPDRRIVVRLSFPGKLATYLAAGLPVLYHGPRESTPMSFFEQYPVAAACNSLNRSEILNSLEQLASDPDLFRRAAVAGRRALEDELGLHVYVRRFAQLVGAEPADFVPLDKTAD